MKHTILLLLFTLTVLPSQAQLNADRAYIRKHQIKSTFIGYKGDSLTGLTLYYRKDGTLFCERHADVSGHTGYEPGDVWFTYFDQRGRDSVKVHAYLEDSAQAKSTGPFDYILQRIAFLYPTDTTQIVTDSTWNIFRQLTDVETCTTSFTNIRMPSFYTAPERVGLRDSITIHRLEITDHTSFYYTSTSTNTPASTARSQTRCVSRTEMSGFALTRTEESRTYEKGQTYVLLTTRVYTLHYDKDTISVTQKTDIFPGRDSLSPAVTPDTFGKRCSTPDCLTRLCFIQTHHLGSRTTIDFYWSDVSSKPYTSNSETFLPFSNPPLNAEWRTIPYYISAYGEERLFTTYW